MPNETNATSFRDRVRARADAIEPATPKAHEFVVGDEVEGECFNDTRKARGTIAEFTEGSAGLFARLEKGSYVKRSSLRLIRPAQAERSEVKFYGTMPSVLPETLPAGTTYIWGATSPSCGRRSKAAGILSLNSRGSYVGRMRHDDGKESHEHAMWDPDGIDWSTVHIASAPPVVQQPATCSDCGVALGFGIRGKCNKCLGARQPASEAKGVCDHDGVPSDRCVRCNPSVAKPPVGKFDIYANTTRQDLLAKRRHESTSGYLEWSDNQDRIAATKHAQALAALSRPIRTGPLKNRDKYGQLVGGGWDSEDADGI